MSSEIRMTGWVSAECKARTVGDLRALVAWCDEYNVSDDCGLDWGSGAVYVELTGDKPKPAEWIECGDHLYPTVKYDFLVNTHYHGPETYEEALEEALEKPAKYAGETFGMYQDRINSKHPIMKPGGMSDLTIPEYDQ
jgi:hypothetical protein